MNITQALAPETRAIVDLLVSTPVGQTVTFAAMSGAIGRPIAERRHLIPRAMAIAAKESGAIFGGVRTVGYQRLPAKDAHLLGAHTRRRMQRSAKRTTDAIVAAVTMANDIPDAAKVRAYAEVNAMALIRHIATDKEVIAATVEPRAEPVALTMRRFARQIGAVD